MRRLVRDNTAALRVLASAIERSGGLRSGEVQSMIDEATSGCGDEEDDRAGHSGRKVSTDIYFMPP